jgi:hypothetical protein
MAVVPGDELGGRPGAAQVLARNPEASVALRADRIDDGVVEAHEVGVLDVPAELDVAEEAEAGLLGDPLERTRDRLQLWVIRRDPETDEAPGRGQPLDHVHLGGWVGGQQGSGGIEAGRAGTDDGDSHCCADSSRACRDTGLRA